MTETLSILFIFELGPTDFGHWMGGVEGHVYYLSKQLIKKGHHITLLTGAIPKNKDQIMVEGINVVRVGLGGLIDRTWNPYNLGFSRQLLFPIPAIQRALKLKTKFDIIHGHVYTSSFAAALVGKIRGCGKISTIHGSYYDVWHQIRKNQLKATLYKTTERILAPLITRLCDMQIHTDRAFAEKLLRWGAPKWKINVIENGVDISLYDPKKVKKPILSDDRPIILSVRRLVPKNGIEYFLRAAPAIHEETNARFVLIGGGPERQNLEKLARNLGISQETTFMGGVPHTDMPKYLAAADIVVVPSLVEATSIAMMEAMAMERPVVASDIPGLREVSSYGKYAKLVPPRDPQNIANAVVALLNDKKRRKSMGRMARTFIVKTKSWESVAKRTLDLYHSVLHQ
ncbi:MAG: glycosyltransferase family 4 protein [Candidatus Hodarchaeota archaeon]